MMLNSPVGASSLISNSIFATGKANSSQTPAGTNIIQQNKLAVNANYILMTSTRNSAGFQPYVSRGQNMEIKEKGDPESESMGHSMTKFSNNIPETASSIQNQLHSRAFEDSKGSPKVKQNFNTKRNNRTKYQSNDVPPQIGISDSENNTVTNFGDLKFGSTQDAEGFGPFDSMQ